VAGLLAASQLGWVAAAVATHERGGLGAGLFLLGAAVLAAVVLPTLLGDLELETALSGLGGRAPARAAALALAAVSLAGVPPLAGFFGVFLVAAALAGASLYWAVTLALVGSILAAVGAVRIAYAAFLLDEEDSRAPARAPSTRLLPATFASGAAAVLTLVLIGYSLLANPISGLAMQGASALLTGR
jgi:NADH-quinone oxidoreductase subunit N